MRARILPGWLLGIMLAGGAVASSFAQDGLNPSQTAVLPDKTGPAVPPPAAAASVEVGTPPQAAPQPSTEAPAAPGAAADKAPPPSGQLSPWYYEIERLTQAGVEDAVILSYIHNSAGTFILTADQVISLENLGASLQVISAMMQHDRQFITGERPLTASTPPAALRADACVADSNGSGMTPLGEGKA